MKQLADVLNLTLTLIFITVFRLLNVAVPDDLRIQNESMNMFLTVLKSR